MTEKLTEKQMKELRKRLPGCTDREIRNYLSYPHNKILFKDVLKK